MGIWEGDTHGHKGVFFLPSEDPAASMTGSCHSARVCCALFHSDALAGMEKRRTCKEATAGAASAALLPAPGQAGHARGTPSCQGRCHRAATARHGAVTLPWLQRGGRDVPSLLPALLPALIASDRAAGQGSFGALRPTLSPLTDTPQGRRPA